MGGNGLAKYWVTRAEPGHISANALDDPCHVRAGNRVLRFDESRSHQAKHTVPRCLNMSDIAPAAHGKRDYWAAGWNFRNFRGLLGQAVAARRRRPSAARLARSSVHGRTLPNLRN